MFGKNVDTNMQLPKQHAGFNLALSGNVSDEYSDRKSPILNRHLCYDEGKLNVQKFIMMHHIDCIDISKQNYQIEVDVYYMSHDALIFYLRWLADAWTEDGTEATPADVMISVENYCLTHGTTAHRAYKLWEGK